MARKKSGTALIRKNLTFPENFDARFARLRIHLGATSDSEVIRMAFVELEAKLGFSPLPAILNQKKTGSKK